MIQDILSSEFEKYIWPRPYRIAAHAPFYDVVFPDFKIVFYENKRYNSIECRINSGGKNSYDLLEILRVSGYDASGLYSNMSNVAIQEYLKQYVFEINTKLQPVLKGDFSVLRILEKEYANTRIIQDKLGTAFVFETEVYKKMIAGNPLWEDDLKGYRDVEVQDNIAHKIPFLVRLYNMFRK